MQINLSSIPRYIKKYLVIAVFFGLFHVHETHKLTRKYFRDLKREYALNFDDEGNFNANSYHHHDHDHDECFEKDTKRQSTMDEFVQFQNKDNKQQMEDIVNEEES